ncbi:MAG: phosphopantetheine-binding protein [Verrucomicrobiales bacterium]
MNEFRSQLRCFLVEHFLFGVDNGLADGDSLLERGVLDSTGVLELVSHLEESYGFKVTDDELVPDNFDSIDSLVQFVQRKAPACPESMAP